LYLRADKKPNPIIPKRKKIGFQALNNHPADSIETTRIIIFCFFITRYFTLIYLKSVGNESRGLVVVYIEVFDTIPFIVSTYVHFLVILWLIITGTRQKYLPELHYALKKID
jgi:hypothetical protein